MVFLKKPGYIIPKCSIFLEKWIRSKKVPEDANGKQEDCLRGSPSYLFRLQLWNLLLVGCNVNLWISMNSFDTTKGWARKTAGVEPKP